MRQAHLLSKEGMLSTKFFYLRVEKSRSKFQPKNSNSFWIILMKVAASVFTQLGAMNFNSW